jgi:hypothetical protein
MHLMSIIKRALWVIGFLVTQSTIQADSLGKVLQGMLHEKPQHSHVNLDYLNLNALPIQSALRTFKPDEVIATYETLQILKKEADIYLKEVTNGQNSDYNRLLGEQRFRLVEELFQMKLVMERAKQALSQQEKEEVFKSLWVAKKQKDMEVSNDALLALYEKKKRALLLKNPNAKVPSFMGAVKQLKREVMENRILEEAMNDVSIEVLD